MGEKSCLRTWKEELHSLRGLKYESKEIADEKHFVIVLGRFSGLGLPVNRIAADIVRIKDSVRVQY
jgi:hypothetical protein